jgi:hypothetical protein
MTRPPKVNEAASKGSALQSQPATENHKAAEEGKQESTRNSASTGQFPAQRRQQIIDAAEPSENGGENEAPDSAAASTRRVSSNQSIQAHADAGASECPNQEGEEESQRIAERTLLEQEKTHRVPFRSSQLLERSIPDQSTSIEPGSLALYAQSSSLGANLDTSTASSLAPSPTSNSLLVGPNSAALLEHRQLAKEDKGSNIRVRSQPSAGLKEPPVISADERTISPATSHASAEKGLSANSRQEWESKRQSLERSQAVRPPAAAAAAAPPPPYYSSPIVKRGLRSSRILDQSLSQSPRHQQQYASPIVKRGFRNSQIHRQSRSQPLRDNMSSPELNSASSNVSDPRAYNLPEYIPEQHPSPPSEELVVARLVQEESPPSTPHRPHNESGQERQPPAAAAAAAGAEAEATISPVLSSEEITSSQFDPDMVLVQAKRASETDAAADLIRSHKGRLLVLGLILAVVLVTGAIWSTLLGIRKSRNSKEDDPETSAATNTNASFLDPNVFYVSSSASPSFEPSSTHFPTILPTMAPTTASTTELQAYMKTLLPNYSLAALEDPTSPQSQALEWLLYDHSPDVVMNYTVSRLLQRYALATLYYSTNTNGWRFRQQWMTTNPNVHECEWWSSLKIPGYPSPGRTICNDQLEYTAILLSKNYLAGTLPPELSLITTLQAIEIVADKSIEPELPSVRKEIYISGQIPTELGLLTTLTVLDLSKNALSGTIPTELGLLLNLQSLWLIENEFLQGTIPTVLAQLPQLQEVALFVNQLTGTIRSELMLSTSIADFFCAHKSIEWLSAN